MLNLDPALTDIEQRLDAGTLHPNAAIRLLRRAREQLDSRSVRAVAAAMGLPSATIQWIEARAIRKLKAAWRFDLETGQTYRPVTRLPGLTKCGPS